MSFCDMFSFHGPTKNKLSFVIFIASLAVLYFPVSCQWATLTWIWFHYQAFDVFKVFGCRDVRTLVYLPTQLTLIFTILYLYLSAVFHDKSKMTNMKNTVGKFATMTSSMCGALCALSLKPHLTVQKQLSKGLTRGLCPERYFNNLCFTLQNRVLQTAYQISPFTIYLTVQK